MKNIVVVGGCFAGITVANKLVRKLRRKDAKVILIEPNEFNIYEPQYVFWGFKKYPQSKFTKPMNKVLSGKVTWLRTVATHIDSVKKQISLSNGETLPYDYLVLATGAKMDEAQVDSYDDDKIHHFYLADATKKLQDALKNFAGGTIVISPSTVPYKCPPAPAEFTFLLDTYLRKNNLRDKTTIKYLYPLMRPYPEARVSEKVQKLFDKRGIEFVEFFNYETVDKENRKVISLEGEEIEYDLLVLIPPHMGHEIIIDSDLGDREGFVRTDRFTLKVKDQENMYAIGDCTDMPISKSGAAAHFSAPALIKNILLEMKGKVPTKKYGGFTVCFVVTSFRRSLLLVFSYNYAPRKFGLHNLFLYGLFKKAFKIVYFKALIKGYL
ncbi:MAG: Sulfide dehydrogenase [flavocytochrome c] flavoprotein chain precursor [Candidatus Heimdallarchaeota archaeon AB_125]|nr:MAG: Sulfide dehydrogenase [flavocytochrome c] flavoprotein chain precursor [Candidatus Heimdallarchaeota archaeon AB_125]